MKKLFVLCLLSFAVCIGVEVLAYTTADVSNASYLATKRIITTQSTTAGYRLEDSITRAEAIGIALKIKGVTLPSYQCKGYFSDVRNNDWICRAAEIAADNGLVTRANARFRPQDNITRAEALAILISHLDASIENYHYFTNEGNQWQKNTLYKFINYNGQFLTPGVPLSSLLTGTGITSKIQGPAGEYFWTPNRNATRAEVFAFARNILGNEKLTNTKMNCEIEGVQVYDECKIDHGDIRYGKYIETQIYGDNLYQGLECAISYDNQGSYMIGSPKPGKYGEVEYIDMSYLENGLRIVLGNNGYYEISSPGNIDNCMNISLLDVRKLRAEDVLNIYYGNLDRNNVIGMKEWAYRMRSPAGVSEEIFMGWYKNVTSVVFREDTMKNLGDNTYEFLVDMTESGVKSTYKVKSKVDLENFKINNLSSVKQ